MSIRTYSPDDLDDVLAVFRDSVHNVAASQYDAAQRAAWAPHELDVAVWRRRLEGQQVLVATVDRKVVAFIAFDPNGHIDLLYRGSDAPRGVAHDLYERAESSIAANQVFTEASLLARPFFERHGLVVTETEDVERHGVTLRRFAMRKSK